MTDVVLITAENYPVIFRAFEMISHDCGRQAGHQNYAVPMEFNNDLGFINYVLSRLKEDEFSVLCIGEQTEAELIVKQYGLTKADKLLQEFFEEFR